MEHVQVHIDTESTVLTEEPTEEELNFSFQLSLQRLLSDPEGCKQDLVKLFDFIKKYGVEKIANPGSCGCADLPGRVQEMLMEHDNIDTYTLAHQLAEEIFNDLWRQKDRCEINQNCSAQS